MKNILIAYALLLLVGAGCVVTTDVQPTPSTPIPAVETVVPVKTETVTTTENVTSETTVANDQGVVVHAKITADVKTTVNCGDVGCFDAKFAACEPATLTSDAGWASIAYTIVGPASGGCKMTMVYPTNPNPAWVNQAMTCTFDNTQSLAEAVEKEMLSVSAAGSTCTGPLATILKNM